MTILDAQGKDREQHEFQNMLAHWLGLVSVTRVVQRAGLAPKKADLRLLAKRELSKERAAYLIGRLLGNPRVKLTIVQAIEAHWHGRKESLRTSGDRRSALDLVEAVQAEVRDLARVSRSGLVLP